MRVALICSSHASWSPSAADWVGRELTARGHVVEETGAAICDAPSAAAAGHDLADRWANQRPDVVLALDWTAGVAAQVGARSHDLPVVLRLARAARAPGTDQDRLETALARSSRRVLVPSAGELDRLVDRGVPRHRLRVLPESVDRTRFPDAGAEVPPAPVHRVAVARPDQGAPAVRLLALLRGLPAYEPLVLDSSRDDADLAGDLRSVHALVVTDDGEAEVALSLRAMSCGVPIVASGTGTLSDLVADGVTGVLVRDPAEVTEALRALLSDPLRRQSMGLAAADRVRARFDTPVVAAALEDLLLQVLPRRMAQAS